MQRQFTVKDLIIDINKLKILFLLESPYLDEIATGLPLAGKSGSSVSNFINAVKPNLKIARSQPFGCYLKESKQSYFGISNCSNIPMDIGVYDDKKMKTNPDIISLDKIRRYPKTRANSRRDENDRKIHNEIIHDLSRRLKKYNNANNKFKIIACGNLAHTLIDEISFIDEKRIIKVPHPSFGQWSQKRYKAILDRMVSELKKI